MALVNPSQQLIELLGAAIPALTLHRLLAGYPHRIELRLANCLAHSLNEFIGGPRHANMRLECTNFGNVNTDSRASGCQTFQKLERPALPDHLVLDIRQ